MSYCLLHWIHSGRFIYVIFNRKRGSVSLIHEKLGEIWYDLTLISKENPVIRVPTIRAELGKTSVTTVELEVLLNK